MTQSAVQKIVASVEDDCAFQFRETRKQSLQICAPLNIEDYVVQSMPEASPIKWHLAHTTWFFDQFVLKPLLPDYCPMDARYASLFNSYYDSIGPQLMRANRGLITRPVLEDVLRYRQRIDEQVQYLLMAQPENTELRTLVMLGLQHEQQHQELMFTDIKHAFSASPLSPAYTQRIDTVDASTAAQELQFVTFEGGIRWVGAADSSGCGGDFSFDNEQPRHRVIVEPFALANRLVTNEEYMAFVRTGGYRRAEYWLADGWSIVNAQNWSRPLYWQESLDSEFTLYGVEPLQMSAPVSHISYYEADAFARWAGMRLPTEFEWEVAAAAMPAQGNLLNSGALHPLPAKTTPIRLTVGSLNQLFGDVWEWTASAYAPYPGYVAPAGALREYNGKFMCNQMVLRGGSCVTPDEHIRPTYRNFFHPHSRWQFSGVRMAR
jgi:ergothioneine biosynthesis protein EgtB